jgi:broad specificity phosphatase PhoE
MPMTLLIARHGQTDLNVDDRWQGSLDLPLNATGRAQAVALAAGLPEQVDALVVSPMLRTRQTAQPVIDRRGLEPRFDALFRERDFGVFEGLNEAEAHQRHPALAAANAAYRWEIEPPGAERARAVVDRVAEGLATIRARHGGQTVLLVTHGFVIRCLRYLIDGLSDDEFFSLARVPNGSLLTRRLD